MFEAMATTARVTFACVGTFKATIARIAAIKMKHKAQNGLGMSRTVPRFLSYNLTNHYLTDAEEVSQFALADVLRRV